MRMALLRACSPPYWDALLIEGSIDGWNTYRVSKKNAILGKISKYGKYFVKQKVAKCAPYHQWHMCTTWNWFWPQSTSGLRPPWYPAQSRGLRKWPVWAKNSLQRPNVYPNFILSFKISSTGEFLLKELFSRTTQKWSKSPGRPMAPDGTARNMDNWFSKGLIRWRYKSVPDTVL